MIFGSITNKFQLKFKDRQAAGNILGEALKSVIKEEERKNSVVLGIPRGGVIIAEVIARKLSCEFDMIISRRVRAPYNEELAIGAVAVDGTYYENKLIIEELKISHEYIQKEIVHQLGEIKKLTNIYYPENKTYVEKKGSNLDNKTIVVVDDGAATGATLLAASRSLKKNNDPKRLIAAVPVAPKGTVNLMKNDCIDYVEVITSPQNARFVSVEQYYRNFKQVTDNQVLGIIQTRK